ncbi:UNVERIFIED_CONTAM: hypothetical protein GTU68_062074 [Idotea baltica]|nr:hypothetical protein [Idotea baltica]
MPVHYPLGVMKEHLHCRGQVGLFDVSHMGQILVTGPHAAEFLESLLPVDIIDLPIGLQRYALFTNDSGGVLDDLMVARLDNQSFLLIVNAACKWQDLEHLRSHVNNQCTITPLFEERALIALQGPKAAQVLSQINPSVAQLTFMQITQQPLLNADCFISRSGYTGEDGYEISVPNEHVEKLSRYLLSFDEVQAIGLGARDSLRLEAGLCLYGHDMDQTTTPIEASLTWAISKARKSGGVRSGGFPGSNIILNQVPTKKRIGLRPVGKAPIRESVELLDAEQKVIGKISSGGFSPTLSAPISMGYVDIKHSNIDNEVYALIRGKQIVLQVVKLPFITPNYFRG